jgi:hypothetical protein
MIASHEEVDAHNNCGHDPKHGTSLASHDSCDEAHVGVDIEFGELAQEQIFGEEADALELRTVDVLFMRDIELDAVQRKDDLDGAGEDRVPNVDEMACPLMPRAFQHELGGHVDADHIEEKKV